MKNARSVLLGIGLLMATGCGSGTAVQLDAYTVASTFPAEMGMKLAEKKPAPAQGFQALVPMNLQRALETAYNWLTPNAYAAVTEVKMCFKRLRIKREEGNNKEGDKNFDLELGLKTLSPSGTDITEVELEEGEYKSVEFDLEDGCGVGYSLLVDGVRTDDTIKIRFKGTHDPANSDILKLGIQAILTAVDGATTDSQLKTAAEGADGTF